MKTISLIKDRVILITCFLMVTSADLCPAQAPQIHDLIDKLKFAGEDTNKVNILFQLSDLSEDDTTIMRYARSALQLAKKLNYQKGIADASTNIGYVYNQQGDISQALKYYEKSLTIRENIEDKSGLAPLLNNIAAVYERQGAIANALEYYQKSLKLREEIGDKNGVAKVFNNIGLLYKSQGDIIHAEEYLQKSLKMMQELNDSNGIAMTLINLGFISQGKSDFSHALGYFEKSLVLYRATKYQKGIASSLYNIGMNYSLHGDNDKALSYFEQSLKELGENRDRITIAANLNNIGKIYGEKKNYAEAEKYCMQSLEIAKNAGVPERIGYASEALSKIYSEEGKYKEAYEMHVLFKQMADSINNQETQKATVKKQMQYEFDKKDALAKAEIKRQTLIRNSTFGGVGIAGIFSFLLVRSFNRRKKTDFENEVSQVEMKALRAQMNPHFIFNSLNSIHSFIQQNKGEKASDYLIKFSRLMRLILENSNHEEVSLESDLEALSLYMELEAARLNNKFTFSIDVADDIDIENTLVPPLILQPFVENSIWHGMMHKEENGLIRVNISKNGEMIKCIVEDNGVGREKAKELKSSSQKGKHESLGMKITNERIAIINRIKKANAFVALRDLYDDDKKPLGTLVEVQLPLETGF